MKLPELAAGQPAEIVSVRAEGALAGRLRMLNIAAGRRVCLLRAAPFGGGFLLDCEGVRVAVRRSLAAGIEVRPLTEDGA